MKTPEELCKFFEDHHEEYLWSHRVQTPFSIRKDLHAFILLDKLVPDLRDIVASASHDEIYLEVNVEQLAKSDATDEQLLDLIRCGVRIIDEEHLGMFV